MAEQTGELNNLVIKLEGTLSKREKRIFELSILRERALLALWYDDKLASGLLDHAIEEFSNFLGNE